MASRQTSLRIINRTPYNMTISAKVKSNSDWDGDSRPDHNLNGVTLQSGQSIKEPEELNSFASAAWYTLTITLDNQDKLVFENDQRDAFQTFARVYKLHGTNASNYTAFQRSNGSGDNAFEISFFSIKNWMKSVPDETSVLNLSIPGTHESCATVEIPYAQCQTWSLTQQLENGVRYFDIRAEAIEDPNGDYLTISHGPVREGINFEKVLYDFTKYLSNHPSETIIMQLAQEQSELDDQKYAVLVDRYVKSGQYKDYFHVSVSMPSMQDARGKIILVNRFVYDTNHGIEVRKWLDNTSFSRTYNRLTYNVQDEYQAVSNTLPWCIDDKMGHINAFFTNYAYQKGCLNLCFCSGTGMSDKLPEERLWASPYFMATGFLKTEGVNERTVNQHLRTKTGWNAVMLFDFVEDHAESMYYVIRNNFMESA